MSSGGHASGDLVDAVLQDLYRVTRLIGRGGMGAVYEGVQLRLGKRVAIKVLARELSANEEALARFRREAEVTSQLGHPHIVQVNDFGSTPSGEPYLVMEFLEGEDLDQRVRRAGRMSLAGTANVIKQIASALSSTHARGIVHRDLKPANVFLMEIEGESDFVKIVDFGISKVRAASLRLTNPAAIMGTPNYMSPEQAAGQVEEVDHRTDQWSLACIAYEMLAGRGPFLGDTIHSLLFQVVNQEPPRLGSFVAGLPSEVEKVVARGLAKAKTDRFPTISAFSRAFVAAASGTAPAPPAIETGALTATVRVERPAPAPDRATAAREAPMAQPTTLSRTASELVTPFSRLRAGLRSRRAVVGAGAAAIGVVALIVLARSPRPTGEAVIAPSRPGGATAPVIAPIATPPPPPEPAAPPAPPPEPAAPPVTAIDKSKRPKNRAPATPALTTKAKPVAPPSKAPPPKPAAHGSIIEEL